MALARLLVRINTLNHVAKETAALASRIRTAWDNALAPPPPTSTTTKSSSSFWGLASAFKVGKVAERGLGASGRHCLMGRWGRVTDTQAGTQARRQKGRQAGRQAVLSLTDRQAGRQAGLLLWMQMAGETLRTGS